MNKFLNKKVSAKFYITIILSLLFIIAIIISYKIGEINIKSRCILLLSKNKINNNNNKIYVPLFIDPHLIKHKSRFKFSYDSPEILKSLRINERLDEIIPKSKNKNSFNIALNLMTWTRQQWEPSIPNPYPPINANKILALIRAHKTGGFCAQYNYVFVQALQSYGIRARYVTILNHEVTEVYIKELNKWICLDPLYSAYYTNKNKIPLSVYEIYKNLKKKEKTNMISEYKVNNLKYHLMNFKIFAIWLKNNHVSSPINFTDIEYYKVYYYEEFNELPAHIFATHLTTSSLKDLYNIPE